MMNPWTFVFGRRCKRCNLLYWGRRTCPECEKVVAR